MLPWSVMPTAGWPSAAAVGDDVADPRRAVEHRVLGVQVEVDERLAAHAVPVPSHAGCLRPQRLSTAPVDRPVENHTACNSPTLAHACGRRRARPRAATSGTSISAAVSEPCAPMQLRLVGRSGRRTPTAVARREHDVADAAGTSPGTRVGTEPALVEQLLARGTPTRRRRASCSRRREQLGRGARAARAGSGTGRRPRTSSTSASSAPSATPAVGPDLHLAVVGGDQQRDVVGQRVEQRADERVGRPRARPGRTRVVEAVRVRDLVDPRVVRVDERRARRRRAPRTCSTSDRRWSASRGTRRRAGARR